MRYLLAILLLVASEAQAQIRTLIGSHVAVRLIDGSTVYGALQRHDADSVVVDGLSGRTAFPAANVRNVRSAGDAHTRSDGKTEYWFPNPNTTRLFFGPTGRTLAQREGYFADHDVFLGSLTYGVTDRLTLGGGSFLVPNSNFWFVTPKVGIVRGEKLNIAAGALLAGVGDETFGVGFVAATAGGTDNNVTVAIGEGFVGSDFSESQVIMLGGERRVARRLSLVTENYVIPHFSQPLVSYGVRILGEKMSVDLAFLNVLGKDAVFPGFPYVDFVIRF